MLDREGVQGLGDLAIVGDENTVRSQLSSFGVRRRYGPMCVSV